MLLEDLSNIHDDMEAFTQGLGLRRFHGYIPDEMPSVLWDGDDVKRKLEGFSWSWRVPRERRSLR